jgi:hypothetical protein
MPTLWHGSPGQLQFAAGARHDLLLLWSRLLCIHVLQRILLHDLPGHC